MYPRDPSKKASGKDKTYYHIKDVGFLMHEPVLQSFRDFKAFMRKLRRTVGRNKILDAQVTPSHSFQRTKKQRGSTNEMQSKMAEGEPAVFRAQEHIKTLSRLCRRLQTPVHVHHAPLIAQVVSSVSSNILCWQKRRIPTPHSIYF